MPDSIGISVHVPQRRADPLPLMWFRDIRPRLETLDYVQGVLIQGSAAVVYGESNAGKTSFALDLSLRVAAGLEWCGRRVEQGGVVYCVLEGSTGFRNRVSAWTLTYATDQMEVHFASIESPLNLLDPEADTNRLIDAVQDAALALPVPVKLIVIDTLSRALAGGNENGSEDMGALVQNMDRIRAETGASVLFIHHSGKDQARGARGHSLLRAAVDTEIEVVEGQDDLRTATIVKQREMKKGDSFSFTLKSVELGLNQRGEPVTASVVTSVDQEARPAVDKRRRLTGNTKIAADLLRRAMDRHAAPLPAGVDYPSNVLAVTDEQWRQTFYKGFPGESSDTKRRAFNRAKTDLLANKVIASLNDWVWFVHRADE